jgi:hypothetical protein
MVRAGRNQFTNITFRMKFQEFLLGCFNRI